MTVATKRVIARACIAVSTACLIGQALGVRVIHHSLTLTWIGAGFPLAAILSGLGYLHQTRGEQ